MTADVLERPDAQTEAKRQFRIGDLICVMHFTRKEAGSKIWWEEIRRANGLLYQPPELYVLVPDVEDDRSAFAPISWLAAEHFIQDQLGTVGAELQRVRSFAWGADPATMIRDRVFLDGLPKFEEVRPIALRAERSAPKAAGPAPDGAIAPVAPNTGLGRTLAALRAARAA